MEFKNVLITGIGGSAGSYLAEYIVENHPEVKVSGIVRWHTEPSLKNLQDCIDDVDIHECDLQDFSSILRVLQEVKPDCIFHLASHAKQREGFINPLLMVGGNVMGTANLLEAIRFTKTNPHIMICSTSELYGKVSKENVPIVEECPIAPVNPYAVSKLTQDFLGYAYHKSWDLNVVRTRTFGYINPRRKDIFSTSFAIQIAKIEKEGNGIIKHGNLDSVRTLIDVRDVARAYWETMKYCKVGEVYNIGGEEAVSVGEILDKLKKHATIEIESSVDESLLRPIDVTLQIPSVDKFKKKTGWKPKYSLDESIDFLLEHCRSNYV
tara:strand:- start:365 stop:1333 length:969 start_codon:yes stop_codon:yes gene_type:complete